MAVSLLSTIITSSSGSCSTHHSPAPRLLLLDSLCAGHTRSPCRWTHCLSTRTCRQRSSSMAVNLETKHYTVPHYIYAACYTQFSALFGQYTWKKKTRYFGDHMNSHHFAYVIFLTYRAEFDKISCWTHFFLHWCTVTHIVCEAQIKYLHSKLSVIQFLVKKKTLHLPTFPTNSKKGRLWNICV